ncbi:MAG: ammonia-forming cytochrome c nitrite reductase subunit c552, partial [Desulfuromonadales bacterium]|nr:ammonia-forming cytochrome c nitrite reductase subunit c552 [Desulfuromonadales bacterium]
MMMRKRMWILALAAIFLLGSGLPALSQTAKGVNKNDCFSCHAEVEKLYSGSTHGKLSCETCHSGLTDHLKDDAVKPVTSL